MTDTLYKYVLVYAFMHTKNTLIDSKNILFNIDSTMKTKKVAQEKQAAEIQKIHVCIVIASNSETFSRQ
jgi:hypothetical protein